MARKKAGRAQGRREEALNARRRTVRRLVLALAATALVASSAPAQQFKMPRVDLDYDKDENFALFKTYSWKDTEVVATDPGMHARIVWYVDRELEKKGLKKSKDGPGDLLVRYYAKKEEGLKGTSSQGQTALPGGAGQLTTTVDFQKVLEGTLLIELQRSRDNGPVLARGDRVQVDRQAEHRR